MNFSNILDGEFKFSVFRWNNQRESIDNEDNVIVRMTIDVVHHRLDLKRKRNANVLSLTTPDGWIRINYSIIFGAVDGS